MALPPDINPDDYEIERGEPLVAEEIPGDGAAHIAAPVGVLVGFAVVVLIIRRIRQKGRPEREVQRR
jgi:hypothetical protein